MKILLSSVLWCPPGQQERLETVERHIKAFGDYSGEFDLLFANNSTDPEVCSLQESWVDALKSKIKGTVLYVNYGENKGWSFGRNTAIAYALKHGYDALAMIDCDLIVENLNWVEKALDYLILQPVFMCRMQEIECRKGGIIKYVGKTFELYDEWLGCINVARRDALEKVGGYNVKDLKQPWGFHDCLWGRQLMAAGLLKPFNGFYPSLHVSVREEQGKTYDAFMDPIKNDSVKDYTGKFWQIANEIQLGRRGYYCDYMEGQDAYI